MSLLVVGTMAFDAIETPFGKTDKILGGAATYIALAASYFTKNIKDLHPDLPIIIITPIQSADVAAEVVINGAYDFILAPIIFPQVLVAVERALKLKAMNTDLETLREQVKFSIPLPKGIIGKSPKFIAALDVARRVAKSKTNIFLSGESVIP